ncbi:hypothetical protein HPP92_011872 [Vanilla planifolia]|uniref:Uncharacterized protein n=1 Tax=Vanilla planifolia TaxID=51239 RepID=A0A835V3X3_VANPL|nr:hypothetical protein HPP92_011872 [Vanilla planifolia]
MGALTARNSFSGNQEEGLVPKPTPIEFDLKYAVISTTRKTAKGKQRSMNKVMAAAALKGPTTDQHQWTLSRQGQQKEMAQRLWEASKNNATRSTLKPLADLSLQLFTMFYLPGKAEMVIKMSSHEQTFQQ